MYFLCFLNDAQKTQKSVENAEKKYSMPCPASRAGSRPTRSCGICRCACRGLLRIDVSTHANVTPHTRPRTRTHTSSLRVASVYSLLVSNRVLALHVCRAAVFHASLGSTRLERSMILKMIQRNTRIALSAQSQSTTVGHVF